MADLVSPDQIRNRSFQTTFRGFDRIEVTEFLEKVSRAIEFLDRERARVGTESTEQVDGDLQSEFQRVSSEIGELLLPQFLLLLLLLLLLLPLHQLLFL